MSCTSPKDPTKTPSGLSFPLTAPVSSKVVAEEARARCRVSARAFSSISKLMFAIVVTAFLPDLFSIWILIGCNLSLRIFISGFCVSNGPLHTVWKCGRLLRNFWKTSALSAIIIAFFLSSFLSPLLKTSNCRTSFKRTLSGESGIVKFCLLMAARAFLHCSRVKYPAIFAVTSAKISWLLELAPNSSTLMSVVGAGAAAFAAAQGFNILVAYFLSFSVLGTCCVNKGDCLLTDTRNVSPRTSFVCSNFFFVYWKNFVSFLCVDCFTSQATCTAPAAIRSAVCES
eukprot:284815074_4